MPKLTDAQLVILAAAAKRDSGSLLPLPKSLKMNKGAASTVLRSLLKHRLAEERPATDGLEPWREDDSGARVALVITETGLAAIGVEPAEASEPAAAQPQAEPQESARSRGRKTAATTSAPQARQGTKLAQLAALLGRKQGCSIAEAITATGWQAHSIRGAISGALKKKLGLTVTSEPVEGRGRVYRVVAGQ